ncbi:right-handed parallel beta-helix repeat-containing protein [Caldicoprobacter algeriensis]|uniref:glycoside hydrolase family 28 protein n=1 Tax=Caldicoprobacter algeriensis TaxID=699281 RepID=UPI00207AA525|nr:glycosyl hydrolase family 28 protein [Caldicoprobacter algeriensis]MCM8900082.1 right-handed parallel beta-helix repeat-containing protein [Caldicoprobacter algeriensis]
MSDYNVRNFGAVGDGKTNDSVAIQKAIDYCNKAGGGRVIIPAGMTCLSGTLVMKSNVEFYIERGAVLVASPNVQDYSTVHTSSHIALFKADDNVENISFTGGGTIDGGGRFFIESETPFIYVMKSPRPFTFYLIGCKNVTYRDITIRDGALWTIRLTGCQDVVIHGIRILNDLKLPNNDGIDLDHCQNVRISDCYIESGDDCICFKTYKGYERFGPCENITVTGCTMVSASFAINAGCEVKNPIRNIVVDSCIIRSSHRGVGVHLSQESNVENILFNNLIIETRYYNPSWWGAAEPIYISAAPWTEEDNVGYVRNIRFSNIICRSENGAFVMGWKQGIIEDIMFENVKIYLEKWSDEPGGRHDIRPIPGEKNGFAQGVYSYPTAGFYLKNAKNVTLRNCEVVWGKTRPEYFRYALESHNVKNLSLDNFKGEAAHPDKSEAIFIE